MNRCLRAYCNTIAVRFFILPEELGFWLQQNGVARFCHTHALEFLNISARWTHKPQKISREELLIREIHSS